MAGKVYIWGKLPTWKSLRLTREVTSALLKGLGRLWGFIARSSFRAKVEPKSELNVASNYRLLPRGHEWR